jgi:hypothetical protein
MNSPLGESTMVKPTEIAETAIEELAESFLNGNITHCADEICSMSPGEAAYVTGCIVQDWQMHRRQADAESLLRAILRRLKD